MSDPKNLKIFFNEFKYKNLQFPANMETVRQFEAQNEIRINVWEYLSYERIDPWFLSKKNINTKIITVNMLLLREKEDCHLVFITNTSNLFKKGNLTSTGMYLYCFSI